MIKNVKRKDSLVVRGSDETEVIVHAKILFEPHNRRSFPSGFSRRWRGGTSAFASSERVVIWLQELRKNVWESDNSHEQKQLVSLGCKKIVPSIKFIRQNTNCGGEMLTNLMTRKMDYGTPFLLSVQSKRVISIPKFSLIIFTPII